MLDPVSAASVPKPFERRSEGVLADSVDEKAFSCRSWAQRCRVQPTYRLEAALDAFVIAVPDIPEVDVAAIHARWQAEERATPGAVDRSLGIDNDSDT